MSKFCESTYEETFIGLLEQQRVRYAVLLQLQIMRTEMSKMIQPPLAVRRIEILRFDES